jgi:hypothetical protein
MSNHSICKDRLIVGRLPNLSFETEQLELNEDLIIIMNRDPLVHQRASVQATSPLDFPSALAEIHPALHTVLIIRTANEIHRDLQQALECYDDIVAHKQLYSPKGMEVHLHQDSTGHSWGRLDCLGKKGVHSRETILDAYADHVKLYSRFIRNKKISLLEKSDIIFSALGILLPRQYLPHTYPDTLYYMNHSVNNHSLIEVIRKRFEVLKSMLPGV